MIDSKQFDVTQPVINDEKTELIGKDRDVCQIDPNDSPMEGKLNMLDNLLDHYLG